MLRTQLTSISRVTVGNSHREKQTNNIAKKIKITFMKIFYSDEVMDVGQNLHTLHKRFLLKSLPNLHD